MPNKAIQGHPRFQSNTILSRLPGLLWERMWLYTNLIYHKILVISLYARTLYQSLWFISLNGHISIVILCRYTKATRRTTWYHNRILNTASVQGNGAVENRTGWMCPRQHSVDVSHNLPGGDKYRVPTMRETGVWKESHSHHIGSKPLGV